MNSTFRRAFETFLLLNNLSWADPFLERSAAQNKKVDINNHLLNEMDIPKPEHEQFDTYAKEKIQTLLMTWNFSVSSSLITENNYRDIRIKEENLSLTKYTSIDNE